MEKRLKLDHPSQTSPPTKSPQPPQSPSQTNSLMQEGNFLSGESLSSPLFFHTDQPSETSCAQDSSEAPLEFLPISQEFPVNNQNSPQPVVADYHRNIDEDEDDEMDDIERLMKLLGLSEKEEVRIGRAEFGDGTCSNSCHCEGGFYSKIVGVKGPKCRKEVERLDGWIKHFLSSGGKEKKEPLRLANMLLGKAAFVSEGADGGFGGLEFPSTIQEFLYNDPPCT